MNGTQKRGSCLGRLVKTVLVLVLCLLMVFFGVGYFILDGRYDVSRSVRIAASPEAIHKQVGDLREWPNWLPFTKHDQSVKVTIDKPTGVGAEQHWTGKGGEGELKFTADDENKGIEYDMVFDKKWKSKGSIAYEKEGDGTKVTWKMTGQNDDILGKWMALLMGPMVGPMFEEGLQDLKKKVEQK